MRRRLILFFGTFVILLVGCGLYWLIAGGGDDAESAAERIEEVFSTQAPDAATATAPSDEVLIMTRDELGRLEAIYRADSWQKQPDGSYHLAAPSVQLFQRDGQALIIRADEGSIYAEEKAGGINPRRGALWGNVQIIYDRAVDPAGIPMEQREGDLIRAYVDNVEFDNDLLQVNTDSRVTVFSPEADILGRGLIIRWNEQPQELRTLQILHGEYMAVKQAPGAMEMTPPGGEGGADAATRQAAGPLSIEQGLRLAQLDSLAMTLDDDQDVVETEPASLPAPRAATRPTAAATEPAGEEQKRPRRNIYRATFSDQVRVDSQERSLSGADSLSLVFEWDSRSDSSPLRPRTETQPAEEPTIEPVAAARPVDTQPTGEKPEAASETTIITWTGPLVIEPIDYTETPSSERFRIEARGSEVVLADGRGETRCRELLFVSPEQVGRLAGTAEQPVIVSGLASEQQLVCPEVRFDRSSSLAWLAGPGHIETAAMADMAQGKQPTQPAATQPGDQLSGGRIDWAGSVVARIGAAKVRDKLGEVQERLTVTEAIFAEGVKLTSQEGADDIRSDSLHVWVDEGELGPYPSKALAEGNVQARQAKSNIAADKLTVTFEQLPVPDGQGGQQAELRATSMVAEGAADGTPARLTQGENNITGGRIVFSRDGDKAEVQGPGTLTFVSESDFTGGRLDQPRPVNITWTKGMVFTGATNLAVLTGDVKLTTQGDSISCQRMEVAFFRPEGEPGEAAKAGDSGDALSGEGLGGLRLSTVQAEGTVVIRSSRQDENRRLVQRLQLTGEKLFYDSRSGQIKSTGYGTLLAEDYRPPQAEEKADQPIRVQRPWQTAFEWHNQMQLTQVDLKRSVLMDGQVSMIHRSGQSVIGTDKLEVPEWPGIQAGQVVALGCSSLTADFAQPEPDADKKADEAGDLDVGSRVGAVSRFSAMRDVNLSDGQYRLEGDSLTYNREQSLAILQGNPTARVIQEDAKRGRVAPVTSPKIHCYLDERGRIKKVVVPDAKGSGSGS